MGSIHSPLFLDSLIEFDLDGGVSFLGWVLFIIAYEKVRKLENNECTEDFHKLVVAGRFPL